MVILLPLIWSALLLGVRHTSRFHLGWIILPVPAALFLYVLTKIPAIRAGESLIDQVAWMPSFGVNLNFILDGLSLIFVLLITGMGALVVLYSIFYLNKQTEGLRRFYLYLLIFMGAMLGVVLSDNLIVLYGFWELTSISSFLLIAFWYGRERSGYGAVKSMLITVFGGLAMFAGFNLLYVMTGTYSVREIIALSGTLTDHALLLPAILLILLGAFTKSAQFPFHIWLPDAMEAPTPVSAYLHSATMVKAGIYLVARLTPVFAGQSVWFWLVSVTGLLTLIYGSFKAIRQTDLKALLAYSTISQLGLIMSLLGLGSAAGFYSGTQEAMFYTLATSAALFHLINHAVFKGSLFMVVGIIDHETGTRDLRKLGGLMTLMPVTFSIALMGAFSMAGLPPFSGFLSKEMFFTAVLNIQEFDLLSSAYWIQLFPVIAWIASVFTFVYSMILVFKTFGGKLQRAKLDKAPHEAPVGLLLPPVILISLTLVFAFWPELVSINLVEPALASIHTGRLTPVEALEVSIHFWHGWTPELFMTMGVVAAGWLLFKGYTRLRVLDREARGRNTLNRIYDGSLKLLEGGSRRFTNAYMTGSNRHYLLYIFSFFIVALMAALLREPGIRLGMDHYAKLSFYELAVIAVMLLSAFAVPFAKSRVNAILFTGGTGYMVTLLFVLFRAPDLALTQMIIETVSVILFLLCFRYLPKLKQQKEKLPFKLPNLIIAVGVGVTVTLVALAAMGSSPFKPISEFFLKESYNLAGGKNVVNVILVDFRGFDTLFEIMVLGIASLAIYGLIQLRMDEDLTRPKPEQRRLAVPLRSNDVILQTMSKGIIIIILIFSLYLFLAGHNHPGGGFIGALMTSAALVLLSIAFGMDQIRQAFPVNYRLLTATGLLLAILTASGSFLFGAPFLSHTFGHFHLPLLGDVELATAVLFDLGVYLAVVGVAMNIILTIGGDKRWNS
ncbi:Na+/H+ antiporter subunit A [Paenibacillus piscarius]|uniref:Na+/H+ antiporter subunit A n=1 Tax=Paenibacillus piscarius TaxID=1089681 RepID=UPI001EE7F3DD|nr:Na+/H+ antiporter subunit A [Paenibacillus piscarius]